MRLWRVQLIFFLSVGFLSAQLSTNTVMVTVSQNASSQPDEALFSLTVASKTLAPLLNPTSFGPVTPSTPFLSASITGLSTSQQSQPACPQAALITDATAQAQALASAAGGSAGAIDGISFPAPTQTATYAFVSDVVAVGSFSAARQV
jgi:hypothetical protein